MYSVEADPESRSQLLLHIGPTGRELYTFSWFKQYANAWPTEKNTEGKDPPKIVGSRPTCGRQPPLYKKNKKNKE